MTVPSEAPPLRGPRSHRTESGATGDGAPRLLLGWGLLVLEFVYLAALHHGIGGAPGGAASAWWHPSRFLAGWDFVYALQERPGLGVAVATLPAALLALGVVAATRSSWARALACGGVFVAALFGFYGLVALRVWEFFHWRGSLVMISIGMTLGASLASPWLARSWLRQHWALQLALYLPLALGLAALLRHTTGTDERLVFNLSPWPALTLFGLEIGAYGVVGLLLALALGCGAWALGPAHRVLGVAGVLGALAIPCFWIVARFGSLPDGGELPILAVTAVCLVLALSLGLPGGAARDEALSRRALHLLLGAILVSLPLFSGRALSTGDYTVTRFVRAQQIIDALASHYEERDEYPESLDELVQRDYLDAIPSPRLGFGFVYALGLADPTDFSYQSLGSSYVLEFEFTEWVQCAYNPPWEDEDYEDESDGEEEGFEEDGALDEAWSCPEGRPELW